MKPLQTIVHQLMIDDPSLVKNDGKLIAQVYKKLGADTSISFDKFMSGYPQPSIESITRARRKVLELNPQLKDEKTEQIRRKREEEFRKEYGRTR